jgi:hypothetical protein
MQASIAVADLPAGDLMGAAARHMAVVVAHPMVAVAAILIDRGFLRSSVIREIQKRRKALCGERS